MPACFKPLPDFLSVLNMPLLATGRALINAQDVLTIAKLRFGQHYADFGSGTLGHFVFPATEMVGPEGKIYAVDILKSALENIASRAKHDRVLNLETVWGNIEKVGGVAIEPGSLDLISMVNITGLIKKTPIVLDEASRLLKPDGRLLFIDWKKEAMPIGPPLEDRVEPEELDPLLMRAGFRLTNAFDAGPRHWGLLYER